MSFNGILCCTPISALFNNSDEAVQSRQQVKRLIESLLSQLQKKIFI